ncbi:MULTISPECIES: hypothetical protein [Nocardia]|uniref:hypothetical protein n=1 Tax=Nocardia TaxID=1817 RepID=UPI0007A4F2A5|nr:MULTISPECIES: hypothetical protein [Nocardia]
MTLSTICSEDVDARFAEIIAAEWPNLTGRQTPEALLYTPGDFDLGMRAAALGKLSASRIRPMPWQLWSLERILARNPDGTWTHPECCLIIPRQAGKSTVLILRVLYGLFKLGENIVFSAHQWETAKALWKRTWAIVKTTPWMAKRVESHTCSQGRGTIVLASGAQVVFTTRSAHAGRGLDRIDLEIYDEAYDLTEADMAALSPTKMAADDPQTIYTSSAVNQDDHPNGHVLASVRRRGRSADELGLFFAEWMDDHGNRTDPETWRLANPSYGVIATEKKLRAELKKFSTPAGRKSFDVEYLGRGDWPADSEDLPALIPDEPWGRMSEAGVAVRGPIAIAVDMTPDLRTCSIGAATWTTADRIRVELGYHGSAADVVERIVDLVERWDPCCLVINASSPAASIVPKLIPLGIEPELTSSTQMADAVVGLLDDALAERLSHAGDPRVDQARETTQTKTLPGGRVVLDYTSAGATRMQVLAAARWGLLTFGAQLAPVQMPVQAAEDSMPEDELMVMGF